MNKPLFPTHSRRSFLQSIGLGAAFFAVPGAFAGQLVLTPKQTEGHFYPDHTRGAADISSVSERILGPTGEPIRNAVVEIWQCDNSGAYLHSKTGNADKRDKNFQGFGLFVTGSSWDDLCSSIHTD